MVAVLAVVGVLALVVALLATDDPRQVPGLRQPGALTEWGLPIVSTLFNLSAALTIGWLLAAALIVMADRSGRFTPTGYRAVIGAARSAVAWLVCCVLLIPLEISQAAGRPVGEILRANVWGTGFDALESVRAHTYAGIAALLIAVLARFVLRPGGALALLILGCVALAPIAVAGHAAQSGDHDMASNAMIFHLIGSAVWVGGLVAVLTLARSAAVDGAALRRYSTIAAWSLVAVGGSGVVSALLRLPHWADVFTTKYGALVGVKVVLLVVLGGLGLAHRRHSIPAVARGDRGALVRLGVVEIGLMAATVGVAVALSQTATPLASGVIPDDMEIVLGYTLPGPPTAATLFGAWRIDLLFAALSVAAMTIYARGLISLRRKQIHWPAGRTIAWMAGWLLVIFATSSGFGRYAMAQFSIHMMVHMVIGMMVPILLALGGPVTLAMRSLPASRAPNPPGIRELIVKLVHGPVARFLTHPLIALALFIVSFFAVYFTKVFELLMSHHLGHVVMVLHFLVVGYTYYWVIIGVDPTARQLTPVMKLGLLMAALPFHAFFGLTLMNSQTAMASAYYERLALPWVDLVADQRLGGGIAWGATEVPIVIVMIALLSQWARSDEREARRSDRVPEQADDDLDRYNAMLAELAFRDVEARKRATEQSPPTVTR